MHMHLTLDALQVLDAIATKGSFAAAAESLHRVPSAITYTVRKLEDDLGIALFDRSGHRAELTEAGSELLREGRFMLRAADELQSRVRRVSTGIETNLSIAVSDLFKLEAIYPILQEFYQQGFGTRIRVMSEVFGGSWDALVSGRADISLGAPGDGPPGGGYSTRLIGPVIFRFAVAPHHPLAALPEPLRELVTLVHWDGFSVAEASRLTGAAASTGRTRYAKARALLRAYLADRPESPRRTRPMLRARDISHDTRTSGQS